MQKSRRSSYKRSAAILGATMLFTKIIGAIYKLPLLNILGDTGSAHFQVTYQIYAVLLAVSTTGIPVALSRLVSQTSAMGRPGQARQYFKVALFAFAFVGLVLTAGMFLFADQLAELVGDVEAAAGIRVLSPAVFLVCLISVYEGYSQGQQDTIPTAVKQMTEVLSKMMIGLGVAWWLVTQGAGSPLIAAGAISGVPIGLLMTLIILTSYQRRAEQRAQYIEGQQRERLDGRRKTLRDIIKISIPVSAASVLMSLLTLADMHVVLAQLQTGAGFAKDMALEFYGVYTKGQTLMVLPSAFVLPVSISIIPAITAALALSRHRRADAITNIALKLTSVLAMPAGLGLSVLSYPILNVLYWNSNEKGPACLAILGIASYFVCMQLVTTAILQAHGQEKTPALTFLLGGVAQVAVDYILVSQPEIGIVGSPVGTVICYMIITLANLKMITRRLSNQMDYIKIFAKPLFCSLVMAIAARSCYELLQKLSMDTIGSGRMGLALCLVGAVLIGVVIYVVLVIATGAITRADVEMLPKGKKVADLLKMHA